MTNIEQLIRERIEKVKPRAKWQFWGIEISRDVAIVICWLVSVMLLGIVMYVIFHDNPWTGLPRGGRYIWRGIIGLPWELIGLLIVATVLAYYLSRRSHELYRLAPWMLGGIMLGTVISGYLLAESAGFNAIVSRHPWINEIYCQSGQLFASDSRGSSIIGVVETIDEDILTVRDATPTLWRVSINDSTQFNNRQSLTTMRFVKVIGEKQVQYNLINAYDIIVLNQSDVNCLQVIRQCPDCKQ